MAKRVARRGFSLIEVLLALGVLALLLAAAFVIYRQVRDRALVNEEISNLRALVAGLHSRFPSGDYRAVTSAYVAKAGLLPSIYLRPDGNGLLNRWGDTMYVSGYGEGANPNDPSQRMRRVQIDYKGFPKKHCVALVSGLIPFANAVYVGTFGGTLGAPDTQVDPGNVRSIVTRCTQTSTVPNTEDKLVMLIFVR
ncbi:type 4 pilus major pilin [Pseudomonas sp.]|uniref:type 4 pilus major pilin n=1 Tax=Pseudomonas sp. TaxID=306 RepID=UPI003C792248